MAPIPITEISDECTLAEMCSKLSQATEELTIARAHEADARHVATACLNRVNQIQAFIDRRIAEFRANAPRDSDWKQRGPQIERKG